jgi:hypothetical protein
MDNCLDTSLLRSILGFLTHPNFAKLVNFISAFMSYPKDLDEYAGWQLEQELRKRSVNHTIGVCDYCGRAGDSEPACKYAHRHQLAAKILAWRRGQTSWPNEVKPPFVDTMLLEIYPGLLDDIKKLIPSTLEIVEQPPTHIWLYISDFSISSMWTKLLVGEVVLSLEQIVIQVPSELEYRCTSYDLADPRSIELILASIKELVAPYVV